METLRVAVARFDPPLAGEDGGLDIELIKVIAERIGATVGFVSVDGTDVDGTLAGLGSSYNCVTGATVTQERTEAAAFLPPYLISAQALAVDTRRLPHVRSVDDLAGLTIGVQQGDAGRPIAERLVAEGKAGAVRVYQGAIRSALTELTTGDCDAAMALAPVLAESARSAPGVEIVQHGITVDHISIAVAPYDQALLGRLTVAQAELEADGTLQRIRRRWLGNPYADQSLGRL